jgi:hypothetical protein
VIQVRGSWKDYVDLYSLASYRVDVADRASRSESD